MGIVTHCLEFSLPDVNRFSKYNRYLRTTAWVIRASNIRFDRSKIIRQELQPQELLNAEELIFRKIQFDSYATEIDCLKNNQIISKSSSLYSLVLFLDEDGLIRLSGRLENSHILNFDSKHPILLDS